MARILLVDDEKNILKFYTEELSGDGHQVVAVDSGDLLLGRIAIHKPDVVVLDIKLVDWDGLDLLQDIRNHYYNLPVILCSAYETFKEDPRSIFRNTKRLAPGLDLIRATQLERQTHLFLS